MSAFKSLGCTFLIFLAMGSPGLAQEQNVEMVVQTNPDLQTAKLVWATDETWIAASGLHEGIIRIYDIASGRMSRQIVIPNSGTVNTMVFGTIVAVPSQAEIAVSTGSGNGITALPGQTISVTGTVYREAVASIAPINEVIHVGDPGSASLTVANTDPADGFSESLQASIVGATGFTAGGTHGLIAAGSTDLTSLGVTFSTAAAAVISGSVQVDLKSDGTGTSNLGVTDLGTVNIPVNVTIDNPAKAVIEELSGGGTFTQNGNNYTLDLGTIAQNSGPHSTLGWDASRLAGRRWPAAPRRR